MSLKSGLCLSVVLLTAISSSTVFAQQRINLLSSARGAVDVSSDAGIQNLNSYESIKFVESVDVNLQALAPDTREFNFNFSQGANFTIKQTHNYDLGEGYYSWNGTVQIPKPAARNEFNADTVNFVVSGDRVFGQIRMADAIYEIRTLQNGQHVMVERDFSKLGTGDDSPGVSLPTSTLSGAKGFGAATRGSTTLRVMQIISNAAINAQGGVSPAVDLLNFYISQSNQAYSATGIPITVQSAGLFRASEAERSTAQQNASGLRNLNDGFQDGLANGTRNSRSADLVAMIVSTPNDPRVCGIVNAIGGGASNGFFVVKNSCTDFTFVHEMGHLFGARHQNDNTTTPFAFGHGIADNIGNFRSIMGTTSTGLPRLGGFSNPGFTVGGRPFGTASFRDNDRVHRERASTVAGFR